MTPPLQRLGWVPAALAAALVLVSQPVAQADVVRPPPLFCPPGSVGQTSHRGPECVKVAPRNCPPGWHGLLGGTCALTPCADDAGWQAGEACVEHLTCLEPYQDDFYDYGEGPIGTRETLMPPPELIAGPPMPRRRRPEPVTRYNAVNLCSAEVACLTPRNCQPERLCVPRGTRALAYRGSNVTPARVARQGSVAAAPAASAAASASAPAPVSSAGVVGAGAGTVDAGAGAGTGDAGSGASRPPGDGRQLEGTAPPSGGCAGCAVGDASAPVTGIGLLALAALVGARRGRRR